MSLKPVLLCKLDYSASAPVSAPVSVATRTPTGKQLYVRHLLFRLVHSITGASTSNAITVLQYCGLIAQLSIKDRNGNFIGSRAPLTGGFLRHLRQIVLNEAVDKGDASATGANANGTNVKESLYVMPFELVNAEEPDQCCPLLGTIGTVDVTWANGALGVLFGTGNSVNGSGATYLEVYALVQERETIDAYSPLIYHRQAPSKFLGEVVNINGKLLALGLGDFSAAAATTIGATDFTTYDVAGNDGVYSGVRQHINAGSYAQSMIGAAAASAFALPNSGSAEVVPFVTPGVNYHIADLPHERDITLNAVVGAGAPGLTDQDIYFVCIEQADDAKLAAAIASNKNMNVSLPNVQNAIAVTKQTTMAMTKKGPVPQGHPMNAFVKRPIRADLIAGRVRK